MLLTSGEMPAFSSQPCLEVDQTSGWDGGFQGAIGSALPHLASPRSLARGSGWRDPASKATLTLKRACSRVGGGRECFKNSSDLALQVHPPPGHPAPRGPSWGSPGCCFAGRSARLCRIRRKRAVSSPVVTVRPSTLIHRISSVKRNEFSSSQSSVECCFQTQIDLDCFILKRKCKVTIF